VAVIRAAGHTSAETASMLADCERGVRLATEAIRTGIVPGGGTALANLPIRHTPGEPGHRALVEALGEPLAQFARNGAEPPTAEIIDVAGPLRAAVIGAVELVSRVVTSTA